MQCFPRKTRRAFLPGKPQEDTWKATQWKEAQKTTAAKLLAFSRVTSEKWEMGLTLSCRDFLTLNTAFTASSTLSPRPPTGRKHQPENQSTSLLHWFFISSWFPLKCCCREQIFQERGQRGILGRGMLSHLCTAVYHPAARVRLMATSTGIMSATASLLAMTVLRIPLPACGTQGHRENSHPPQAGLRFSWQGSSWHWARTSTTQFFFLLRVIWFLWQQRWISCGSHHCPAFSEDAWKHDDVCAVYKKSWDS